MQSFRLTPSWRSGKGVDDGLKQSLKVRVVEFNDTPSFAGIYNYSGDEGLVDSISGTIQAADSNSIDGLTYSSAGRPLNGFTIDANGNWNLDTTGIAFQRIAEGEINTFTTYIAATDSKGASSIQELTFNIVGINDAPVATYTTDLSVLEGASDASGNALLLSGQLSATDVDTDAF